MMSQNKYFWRKWPNISSLLLAVHILSYSYSSSLMKTSPRVALLTNSFLFQEFIYHHRCFVPPIAFLLLQPKPQCHWFLEHFLYWNQSLPLCQGLTSQQLFWGFSFQNLAPTYFSTCYFKSLNWFWGAQSSVLLHNCFTSNFYNIFISTLLLIHNNLHIQFIIAWLSILCDLCRF